jgi:hypothetical protein
VSPKRAKSEAPQPNKAPDCVKTPFLEHAGFATH